MDGDKELIDKLQHVWHSARSFPQEPWDRIIALVREHDAAETRVDELKRKLLSCVFCGFVGDDVEQLKAHSAVCEKHPIAALKLEVAMWRSEHDPCPFSLENETLRAENERLENQIKRFLEPKGENDGR